MTKEELRDAIMAVADDAEIIFFDPSTIDLDGVELGCWPVDDPNPPHVPIFIPVQVRNGKSVRDCVYAVGAAEVKQQIEQEQLQ